MTDRVQDLRSIASKIHSVKELMIDVATWRRSIEECEPEYRAATRDLAARFHALAALGLPVEDPNSFSSLWQWMEYWRAQLPTYASRRAYVHALYDEIVKAVEVVEREHAKRSLTSAEVDAILARRLAPEALGDRSTKDLAEHLHPLVLAKAGVAFSGGDFDHAVFVSFRTLEEQVRFQAGLGKTDFGVELMTRAFSPKNGRLRFSDVASEQEAMHMLFRGAIGAFKNPLSHRSLNISDRVQAAEMIGLASLLLRLLEAAETVGSDD